MDLVIGVGMIMFGIGGGIGLALGLSLGLYELEYRKRKRKLKGHKQYIVIELAEGYSHLYEYKIFDNYDDAYNYYKEAEVMEQIKYAQIAEYVFLESFKEIN